MDDASELQRLTGVGEVLYADPDVDQEELRDVLGMFGEVMENDVERTAES